MLFKKQHNETIPDRNTICNRWRVNKLTAMRMTQAAPIIFGTGSLQMLRDELKNRGLKKTFIITDKGVTGAGVTEKVKSVVKEAGLECGVWDNCLSDAPTESVDAAASAAREAGADAIIALGGGSSMDTAKAASLSIKNNKTILEITGSPPSMGPPIPREPDVPIFTIPTTSGTGSEVTTVAVLVNSENLMKFGVVITGSALAIVDPELTVGVPPQITAMTGMDVVAHAVEAITGAMRNPMSDLKGYEALRLVNAHLYDAVKDGTNITARGGMSFASSLAGLAFNDSITSLGHAISQALSHVHHLHHGLLCGLATPPQLEVFAMVVPERVRKIGEIFGADIPFDAPPEQVGKIAAEKIRVFMSQIGIQSFEQMGYARKDITDHVNLLMDDMMLDFSPCEITKDIAYNALDRMYDYKGA